MPLSGTELPRERLNSPDALRARAVTLRQHARYFPGDMLADELVKLATEMDARAARLEADIPPES
jgi:hypothetical protein